MNLLVMVRYIDLNNLLMNVYYMGIFSLINLYLISTTQNKMFKIENTTRKPQEEFIIEDKTYDKEYRCNENKCNLWSSLIGNGKCEAFAIKNTQNSCITGDFIISSRPCDRNDINCSKMQDKLNEYTKDVLDLVNKLEDVAKKQIKIMADILIQEIMNNTPECSIEPTRELLDKIKNAGCILSQNGINTILKAQSATQEDIINYLKNNVKKVNDMLLIYIKDLNYKEILEIIKDDWITNDLYMKQKEQISIKYKDMHKIQLEVIETEAAKCTGFSGFIDESFTQIKKIIECQENAFDRYSQTQENIINNTKYKLKEINNYGINTLNLIDQENRISI